MDQPGHTDATDDEPDYDDPDMTNEEFEQKIANAVQARPSAVGSTASQRGDSPTR